MNKSPIAFVMFFICGAYAATHLDTENRLWFNADVVKNAIVEFVPESKQQPVADLYQDLMDQTTGKISVDSLFKVCRKAGFNTYKYEGFAQCKSFIQKMLMDAEIAQSVDLNGFCPGLDEKGNNPNKLRSITDKTRIGDFCSSTNIRMGQVIFKPGYNCSCMASVCNPGFEFQGGACVTRIADGNGDCLREAYPKTSENNYLEKCKSFCEKKYAGRACKYTSVVMSHSTGQCICNPNSTEIDAAYESMHQAKEKRINNLKYYEVCGDHKGKSGGTEVCVEGVFNWVNIGRLQASGLAEEYARVRYKDTVHCDTVNIRTSWNDDYVKCASMNSKRYYEFQFDDVKESVGSDIQAGVVLGICNIHNLGSNISVAGYGAINYTIQNLYNRIGDMGCKSACTPALVATARHMGLSTTTEKNFCILSNTSIKSSDAESKLAKIDGIDNYVFFHGIQIQGSQNVISQLRQYIKSTGKTVRTFDCNKNVGEIKNSLLAGDDDVLRCKLNGQPIDFVFDDFSESWLYVQEVGESKMQCIVSGGKFAGQECYGLTQKQCTDANAIYLKQNPGASGFRWDGKECVSIDANEAQFYDGTIQVGTGAIALVDCVFGTKLGCVLVAVESASLVAEMGSGVAIENRAGDFLALATRCNDRNCAINILRNDASRVLSVKDVMDATSLNSVDQGLAHLVDKLEPEDLSGVSDGDWDAIVRQLGGDPEDASGSALVALNKIGLIGQFASVGASGLRLTAQAITKLAGKGSRIGRTTSTVARVLDTSGDGARAANNASDAARAANSTADATNAASDAGRATNNTTDVTRVTNTTSDVAQPTNATTDAIRAVNNTTDASRVTATTSDVVRTTSYSLDELAATDANTILRNVDNMSESDIRTLTKKLTPAKRAEIAQLKMGMKPGNMTVQQFADSDDLLFIRGEFSTFDPVMSRELRPYKPLLDKYDELYVKFEKATNDLENASNEVERARAYSTQVAIKAEYDQFLKNNEVQIQEFVMKSSGYLDDTELTSYASNFGTKVTDIILESPELARTAREWNTLTDAQQIDFLQTVANKIDPLKSIKVQLAEFNNSSKLADYSNGVIRLDLKKIKQAPVRVKGHPNLEFTELEKAVSGLVHEYGHFIDDIDPNAGILGSQRARMSKLTPLNKENVYKHILTERSSFALQRESLLSGLSSKVNTTNDAARTTSHATNATADAARTTSRTTNTAVDGTRMFGRTNVDDIGMVDKGWKRAVFDGVDRFRHKKITYPEEADDVRRALEATKGQHNLAYMGVKDGYIVIAYESDLERAWPAFNRAVSGMTDAARTTSRTTNTATDVVRSATASKYATDADANLIAKLGGADVFDSAVDGWRRDWADVAFPKSKLTDSEWNKLNQSLEKYNMEFVQGYFRNRPNDMTLVEYTPDNIRSLLEGKDIPTDAYGTLSSRPVSFKYIMDEAKTGREIFIDVGDAKEQVFQTFMRNNGLEYDRASMKVYNPSATPLQRAKGKLYTYGQTFDKTIDDFLYRNGGYPASWRRADLTDAEFDVLRADLRSHDLLLDTDPEGFLRISRISDSATNAAKTTSHATNATADAARTATNATDAARTANNASDAVRQGSINISQADEDLILDAIIKKQSNKLSRTEHIKAIRTMDKYFDAGAADDFARQMRKDLVDAFVQDPRPEIIEDGQAFAEFIIEKLGPKYGIPQGTIRVQIAPVSGGYASYLDNVLTINPHAFPKGVTLNDRNIQMINLITHEFVHAIDDLAPEYGVIGKKLNAYGDLSGLYVGPGQLMDGAQDMYELIPTERAAHKVSDIVSGATNYGREIGDNPILDELINVLSQ